MTRDQTFDRLFDQYKLNESDAARLIFNQGWNHALLEAAQRIEAMRSGGDTAQSFAVYLRNMANEQPDASHSSAWRKRQIRELED